MIRLVRWVGLTVVLGAAAVLSFDALRSLALAVSIPSDLAWLLPIAVDAGAAVSCAVWLSRDVPADAARFARAQTWLLLGGTVIGNAGQLGMHAHAVTPPWWVAVLVGAIPPAVVGGTVHLAVLVGRSAATRPADEESTEPDPESKPIDSGEPVDDESELPDRRGLVDVSSVAAIASDLQAIASRSGRPFTQDEVRQIYGIGADKAGKARRLLGWWPRAVEQSTGSD